MVFYLTRYRFLIDTVFLTICTFYLSQVIGNIIIGLVDVIEKPNVETGEYEAAYKEKNRFDFEAIIEKNIFNPEKANAESGDLWNFPGEEINQEPTEPIEDDLKSAPVKSDIGYKLAGTIISLNKSKSTASIEANGKYKDYKIGDKIDDQFEVLGIERGVVIFLRNHRREYLSTEYWEKFINKFEELPEPPPADLPFDLKEDDTYKTDGEGIAQVKPNRYVISETKWADALSNLAGILMDAQAAPNFENGKINGFTIVAVRPGSIFQFLGIEVGDTITMVNNQPVNSIDKVLTLFKALKGKKQFEIQVIREGTNAELHYDVR